MSRFFLVACVVITACQSQPVSPSVPHAAAMNAKIVFDGNSLTAPSGALPYDNWPVYLKQLLNDPSNTYLNAAVAGQTTEAMLADTTIQIDAAYDANKARNILFVFTGTNDIGSAADTVNAIAWTRLYCIGRSQIFRTYLLTCIARHGQTANIQAYNNHLRQHYTEMADVLVDLGALPEFDEQTDTQNATYYVDGIHLTPAGYLLIANAVYKAVRANE